MSIVRIALSAFGFILIGLAIYIFSLPAGHATIGDVRGAAGLCGGLIGGGLALIGWQAVAPQAAYKQDMQT
jgi:hypothetical protein